MATNDSNEMVRHQEASLHHVWKALSSSLLRMAGYPATNPETKALATAAVAILFGSYRRDEAAAVEIFREAMVAVLAEYLPGCIRHVTDPRTGIQSARYLVTERVGRETREVRGKFASFPPNVGELQEACERYMAPIHRRVAREETERRQLERRLEQQREDKAFEADRASRMTLAELREKHRLTVLNG